AYGAMAFYGGAWVAVAQVRSTQRPTARNRLNLLRKLGCVVKCACGCDVWSTLGETQFDHVSATCNGGPNRVGYLQPLRRDPCHFRKTKGDLQLRDKVKRIREKFFGLPNPSG